MATDRYRPSLRSRLTAAIFTDRPGQTLAAVIGFLTILRWWTLGKLGRRQDLPGG
jgi:hypothetical protein